MATKISNILIVQSDGPMLLASGATGKVRPLTPEEAEKVLPLLKQRQELGKKLAELLLKKDYRADDGEIWDLQI